VTSFGKYEAKIAHRHLVKKAAPSICSPRSLAKHACPYKKSLLIDIWHPSLLWQIKKIRDSRISKIFHDSAKNTCQYVLKYQLIVIPEFINGNP